MKKLTRHKFTFIITLISTLILLGGTSYLIYNLSLLKDIENLLRLLAVIVLIIIALILVILGIRFLNKYKKPKIAIIIILMLIFGSVELFIRYNINKVYGTLKKLSKTD